MSLRARSQIRLLEKYVYLDNASAGPLPEPVVARVGEFVREWEKKGEPWEEGIHGIEGVRRLFAKMVNAKPDEVACFPGVTYGLGIILSSLPLRKGNVIVGDHNFPTSIFLARSLQARGLVKDVRTVKLSEAEEAIDDETALVMIDYVGWLSGEVADLRALAEEAHEHGALLVVDAFHAAGVMPIDVKGLEVDVLVTGSYKWLMSIHGAAVAYIREELVNSLEPVFAGWLSVEDSVVARMLRGEPEFSRPIDTSRLELLKGARKLEPGTLPLLSFVALEEALRFVLDNDAPGHYPHTWKLAEKIAEEAEALGLEVYTPRKRHAAIVSLRIKDPMRIAEALERRKIRVAARPGLIRVSPHFYNSKEDVEIFAEGLRGALRESL